jgi:hypothetical protein
VSRASRRQRQQRASISRSAPEASAEPQAGRYTPDWRWRTFPVFCALVAGLLVASFINGRPNNTAAAIVQLAAILGAAYALVHLFVSNVIVAGRIRRRDEAIARGDDDDEYEDEVVYPDGSSSR